MRRVTCSASLLVPGNPLSVLNSLLAVDEYRTKDYQSFHGTPDASNPGGIGSGRIIPTRDSSLRHRHSSLTSAGRASSVTSAMECNERKLARLRGTLCRRPQRPAQPSKLALIAFHGGGYRGGSPCGRQGRAIRRPRIPVMTSSIDSIDPLGFLSALQNYSTQCSGSTDGDHNVPRSRASLRSLHSMAEVTEEARPADVKEEPYGPVLFRA
jgi:hypothetical protein